MSINQIQELKNKFKIFELVKNHFSLTDKSLNLFKYRLFYAPIIAKEYLEIIKDSKDLRKRIKIPEKFAEDLDKGWKLFQDYFRDFCYYFKISFKDYRKNKIKIDSQEIKIKKALEKFYIENYKYAFMLPSLENDDSFLYIFKECLISLKRNTVIICNNCGKHCKINYNLYDKINIEHRVKVITEEAKELIKKRIIKILEKIGTVKIPNRGLELVFSLNFADWFLCSAGEKWNSCISLDSSYEASYWTGLPGLICDKNRAMIYITDGEKKNYNGIIVDKIISRSWILLIRSKEPKSINKTFISYIREYPSDFNLKKLSEEIFKISFFKGEYEENCPKSFIGRYYFELLWHKVKENLEFFQSIYFDTTTVKIARRNKAKYFKKGTFGLYEGPSGATAGFERKSENSVKKSDIGFYYDGGLNRLIHNKVTNKNTRKIMNKISEFFENGNSFTFDSNDGFEEVEEF